MRVRALTIAGSDSGGGAGLQADLKSFAALGVDGAAVATAITAQNASGVRDVSVAEATLVASQLEAVLDEGGLGAMKTGMLGNGQVVDAICDILEKRAGENLPPLVIDPVLLSTSGKVLLDPAGQASLLKRLLPLAAVVTPNTEEAAHLTHSDLPVDEDGMTDLAMAFIDGGARAVYMKGGHVNMDDCLDLLVTEHSVIRLQGPRRAGGPFHGTGCALSAALAAGLARGMQLPEAARQARGFVDRAIQGAEKIDGGKSYLLDLIQQ